jgi:hypothetical protein
MLLAIMMKQQNIMRAGNTRRRHTMHILQGDTPTMPVTTPKRPGRLMQRNTEESRLH